ncbi:MAG: hypothetical protein LBS57_11340 [Treponema sp.]|nr:hypothetical protein [Treponema sp.]
MNTIPTIFNEPLCPYTAVGGKDRLASTGLSAVLLNRGGRFPRRVIFQELEKIGFDYVISVESSPDRYDVEELAGRFPFVRFILLSENISPGRQINLAVSELSSPLFFVLWNDLKIIAGGSAGRMAERLCLTQEEQKERAGETSFIKRLCTVPVIQNARFETLPTLSVPAIYGKKVRTVFFTFRREGMQSLYPFDGAGIYDRERFIRLGGFDGSMKNYHWQLMDFGFRARLWGEEICCGLQVKLSYDGEPRPEDNTAEESYRRFYFKNIAPIFRGDYAHLPFRRFPAYLLSSGEDPFTAWGDFVESRRWIKTNRFRWRSDAKALVDRWDVSETASAAEQAAFIDSSALEPVTDKGGGSES